MLAQHATGETVIKIAKDYGDLHIADTQLAELTYNQVQDLRAIESAGRPLLWRLYRLAIAPSQVTPKESKRLADLWAMAPEVMPTGVSRTTQRRLELAAIA